jgi:GNAT superfamily N-acetyltransferase
MIISVDQANLLQAATIHSISWQDSHRAFCTPDFIDLHSPDRQLEYLNSKMNSGSKIYMLIEEEPVGIVSVTDGLIEDLYVLPDKQNRGYGSKLLQYAIKQCTNTPTLWILENNTDAERLYRRMGFKKTGRKNAITGELDEIEFALTE